MKLILMRHGRTLGNEQEIIQGGQTDGELSEEGKKQAKKAAQRLKNERIDVIIISPLQRTKQTSEPIIKEHPAAEIIYDKEVREKDFGLMEGTTYKDFFKRLEDSGKPMQEYKEKGGETSHDVFQRAKKFANSIIHKYKGKTVLIISHGTFIRILMDYLMDKKFNVDRKHSHDNTGISIIELKDDGNHKAHLINCTKHLE